MSHPASGDGRRLPVVAFVGDPVGLMAVREAASARSICELVWVVDLDGPSGQTTGRILRKLGRVVNRHGLGAAQIAEALRVEGVDGVLATEEDSVVLAAELASALGLPGHSRQVARRLVDKLEQRTALRAAAVRAPGFWAVSGPEDDESWAVVEAEARFPAVLKPRISNSSRNTVLVHSIAEARDHAAAAGERSGFLVEEFIPEPSRPLTGTGFAPYVSVESLVSAGTITHVATNGRTALAPPFRETGTFIPSALDPELLPAVLQTASDAIRALGVTDGAVHTEIKPTDDGPYVIEVNGRIGGGVADMVSRAAGVDLIAEAYRIALGLPPLSAGMLDCERVGYVLFHPAPPDIDAYAELSGLDELREHPGIESVDVNRRAGEPIDWRQGTTAHLFRVLGTASDHDGVRAAVRAAAQVRVIPA